MEIYITINIYAQQQQSINKSREVEDMDIECQGKITLKSFLPTKKVPKLEQSVEAKGPPNPQSLYTYEVSLCEVSLSAVFPAGKLSN